MIKNKLSFICFGQGGGNIGKLLYKKGYYTIFLNASPEDLSTLDGIPDDLIIHIPYTKGCSKDPVKGYRIACKYNSFILDSIKERFYNPKYVFGTFTTGGGFGAGVAPKILHDLSLKNTNAYHGAMTVLPSNEESLIVKRNGAMIYQQLTQIPTLKNIYTLDNNCELDKMQINEEFVDRFTTFIENSIPHERGNFDHDEWDTIFSTRGNVVIERIENMGEHTCRFSKSIFAPHRRGCDLIALSTREEMKERPFERTFGTPIRFLSSYNNTSDLVLSAGIPLMSNRVKELSDSATSQNNDRFNDFEDYSIDLPIIESNYKVSLEQQHKNNSFDRMFKNWIE